MVHAGNAEGKGDDMFSELRLRLRFNETGMNLPIVTKIPLLW